VALSVAAGAVANADDSAEGALAPAGSDDAADGDSAEALPPESPDDIALMTPEKSSLICSCPYAV